MLQAMCYRPCFTCSAWLIVRSISEARVGGWGWGACNRPNRGQLSHGSSLTQGLGKGRAVAGGGRLATQGGVHLVGVQCHTSKDTRDLGGGGGCSCVLLRP